MLDVGFEVEVEPVQTDIAERTQSLGAVLLGAEGLPDQLCAIFGVGVGLETTLAVGGASDGQQDRLSLLLAGLDVLATGVLVHKPQCS